jgi:hypothetical protein
METRHDQLQEMADQYLPVDVAEDYPADHMAAEGMEAQSAYLESLVSSMVGEMADSMAGQTHALYLPFPDVILLREYEDDEMESICHEHEFVHRLSFKERDKSSRERLLDRLYGIMGRSYTEAEPGDPRRFFHLTTFEPEDRYNIVTDQSLASKYGVDEELTEAVQLSDRDFDRYNSARSEMKLLSLLEFDGDGNWWEDPDEGTISIDMEGLEMDQFDEYITHYLTVDDAPDETLRRRGFEEEKIESAHRALRKLDRATGYDPGSLVRKFGRCEDLKDLLLTASVSFSFRPSGDHPNGYLVRDGSSTDMALSHMDE